MAVIEPTPAIPPPVPETGPPAGWFYDARRGVHYTKPVMRGWLHLLWFTASLGISGVLLARAHGTARVTGDRGVRGQRERPVRGQRAVPLRDLVGRLAAAAAAAGPRDDLLPHRRDGHAHVRLATGGGIGVAGLIALWTLTGTAAAIHMAWMNAPERLVGGTFIALGWVAALALPEVWVHSGAVPGVLMLGGCLLYLTGAISYHFPLAGPVPLGVRLSRGVPRLRLRRRRLPVRRDRPVHRLVRAGQPGAGQPGTAARKRNRSPCTCTTGSANPAAVSRAARPSGSMGR